MPNTQPIPSWAGAQPAGQVPTYGAGGVFTGYAAPPSNPTVPSSNPAPVTPAKTPVTPTPVTPSTPTVPATPPAPTPSPIPATPSKPQGSSNPSDPNYNPALNYNIPAPSSAPTTYYTSSGQPYTVDSQGNVKYTSTTSPGGSTGNANEDALNKSYADQAAAAKTFADAVTNITNGTTPLNPGEQAQVDGLKAQFQQLIDQQNLTNTGATGTAQVRGYQGGAAEYDPTFQAKTIGSVMSAGATKIANLQTQEASAVASLTQSLQNNDIANLKTAWDVLTSAQKATQEGLKNAIADTQSAINDAKIQSVMASGVIDPGDILAKLQSLGYTDISSKDISEAISNLSPDAKDIFDVQKTAAQNGAPADVLAQIGKSANKSAALAAAGVYNTTAMKDIATQAAKFGAPKDVLDAISKATNEADAISAAAGYLQDPTSTGGMYSTYLNQQKVQGKIPMSAGDFIANQKYADALAAAKADHTYDYQKAYNAEAGKNAADATYSGSDKGQQKLEKEYTANLIKELQSRTGDLGVQNAKVSQAIHLKSLIDQNTVTDKNGNKTYNITPQQQVELVMGLANLLAGSGGVSDTRVAELNAKTAAGDFKGAVQYITGIPQKGSTDAIIKNLSDTIDRQGTVAEDLRSQYLAQFRATKPTDLSDDRAAAVEHIQDFPSFKNPVQNIENAAAQAKGSVDTYTANNPKMVDKITQAMQIPGMNDALLLEYMKNPASGFDNYGDLP